eukprot:Nk52_evm1s1006 gene=Nk52_evmTU1s1006
MSTTREPDVENYPLPRNCMERIVFCIDISSFAEEPLSLQRSDHNDTESSKSKLDWVKSVVFKFVIMKLAMYPDCDEFAVAFLTDKVVWLSDFTKNLDLLESILDQFSTTERYESADIGNIYKLIEEKAEPGFFNEEATDISQIDCVYRAILMYSRPFELQENISGDSEVKQTKRRMLNSRKFFIDGIVLLGDVDPEIGQSIFDSMTNIELDWEGGEEESGKEEDNVEIVEPVSCYEGRAFYFYSVSTSPKRLHNYMAMLLAHPLQRPRIPEFENFGNQD